MRATGLWWQCKLYTVVEFQIVRGDGIGYRTTKIQIKSPTSKNVRHSNHFAREDATQHFDKKNLIRQGWKWSLKKIRENQSTALVLPNWSQQNQAEVLTLTANFCESHRISSQEIAEKCWKSGFNYPCRGYIISVISLIPNSLLFGFNVLATSKVI